MTVSNEPCIRNGLNIDQMHDVLDAIRAEPFLARFQFRAQNQWLGGARNRSTIKDFCRAGQGDCTRAAAFTADAGALALPLATDTAPNPAEYLLHALAACLTASLVSLAAARNVRLTEVESIVEGHLDLQGTLGLNDDVRNGFSHIRATLRVEGDAPREVLDELVARARARSVVFDSISRGVPIIVQRTDEAQVARSHP